MERNRKLRKKKKMEMKRLISDKIMNIVKKLENNIQNKLFLWMMKVKVKKY